MTEALLWAAVGGLAVGLLLIFGVAKSEDMRDAMAIVLLVLEIVLLGAAALASPIAG